MCMTSNEYFEYTRVSVTGKGDQVTPCDDADGGDAGGSFRERSRSFRNAGLRGASDDETSLAGSQLSGRKLEEDHLERDAVSGLAEDAGLILEVVSSDSAPRKTHEGLPESGETCPEDDSGVGGEGEALVLEGHPAAPGTPGGPSSGEEPVGSSWGGSPQHTAVAVTGDEGSSGWNENCTNPERFDLSAPCGEPTEEENGWEFVNSNPAECQSVCDFSGECRCHYPACRLSGTRNAVEGSSGAGNPPDDEEGPRKKAESNPGKRRALRALCLVTGDMNRIDESYFGAGAAQTDGGRGARRSTEGRVRRRAAQVDALSPSSSPPTSSYRFDPRNARLTSRIRYQGVLRFWHGHPDWRVYLGSRGPFEVGRGEERLLSDEDFDGRRKEDRGSRRTRLDTALAPPPRQATAAVRPSGSGDRVKFTKLHTKRVRFNASSTAHYDLLSFKESFGKRSGGGGRRANECLILEPSEMIVIDYPDGQLMRPGQRSSVNTMNLEKLLALEQEEITIRPRGGGSAPAVPHQGAHMAGSSGINHQDHISTSHHSSPSQHHHPHHNSLHYHQDPQYLPDLVSGGMVRGGRSRGSVGSSVRDGSDTSSAYSGSDTMCHSLQSSIEPDDVDLSGLMESIVDSDEEDLAESIESLVVRDAVRECLEKDPAERKEDDIEVLLEFTQRLKAFSNLTLEVRRAMCYAMVFAVVVEAQTILMNDGEELDSWSVIINGSVEVTQADGTTYELHLGDSFGITPTMEKMYHQGVMRSKVDDCQFVCIRQSDYYRILHQGEENTHRLEEDGVLVLLTEQRNLDGGSRKGNIVIKGTPEILMSQLVEVENNVDPTYVEDFLLTHRTFIENPLVVANKLLHWFEDPSLRDRVTRVVVLWVNNHFSDFERAPMMMNFLEQFEDGLEREKMVGQLRLLDIACANKARARTVTLTIPSKDDFLHFSILGGYEKGYGIFISKVEKGSKAEEVGLKRGDQILEVNGQKFCNMSHTRALELLRSTCHLSITVKSNLLEFKEMLQTPDGSPRPRNRKCSEIQGSNAGISDIRMTGRLPAQLPPDFASTINLVNDMASQHSPREKKEGKGTLMTNKLIKAMKNLMPKNSNNENQINSEENISPESSVGGQLYRSYSNPDISTSTGGYEDVRAEYPEHVLKVYRATDQSARFLLVHKETTAREVVMLSLQIFNISDPTGSNNYALYEVTVTEEGIVKQKRLPDLLENLAERIGLNSRYYLKSVTNSQTLVPDEIVSELIRESQVHFLQLKSVELAIQLTLEDFAIFRQIEPTEYIDYLFNLKSNYGTPALSQFEELVNREMFWVATEICTEHTLVKRSKIIKQFIKVARQCKECKNFNSMFAILSGLGHGAVSRLRQTWERLPSKYLKMFQDMQDLMDPSRNMSKYRNLINNEHVQPPIIPFYPIVARDLTFTHEGNDDKVDGLVNFEKLRMIARYIRELKNMCSAPYDLFTMLELGGQPHSTAMIAMNQMTTGGHQVATVKRRKKSTAAPDKKKMFEEAQMVRRVKAYLSNLRIITDEDLLRNMSLECEPGAESSRSGASGSNSAPSTNPQTRKRHHSPTPSTTSSTSSTSHTSDSKKTTAKFGAASPASMRKIMSLAESKTKPYHGPRPSNPSHHSLSPSPSPGPPRRGGSSDSSSFNPPKSSHERSHSDTPAVPVNLSPESSSVTSLSNLRKSLTSGSVNSSEGPSFQGETDSGISTSSLEGGVGGSTLTFDGGHYPPSPPSHHRRFSHQPGVPSRHDRMRRPPDYTATQMRMNQGMRTLSHDGYYTHHQEGFPFPDDDEEAQVSAV